MDPETQKKIDAILARVKEPETRRSVGDLNLVKRVRYSAREHAFELFMDIANPRTSCFVCGVVTADHPEEHRARPATGIRAGVPRLPRSLLLMGPPRDRGASEVKPGRRRTEPGSGRRSTGEAGRSRGG